MDSEEMFSRFPQKLEGLDAQVALEGSDGSMRHHVVEEPIAEGNKSITHRTSLLIAVCHFQVRFYRHVGEFNDLIVTDIVIFQLFRRLKMN